MKVKVYRMEVIGNFQPKEASDFERKIRKINILIVRNPISRLVSGWQVTAHAIIPRYILRAMLFAIVFFCLRTDLLWALDCSKLSTKCNGEGNKTRMPNI